jgi:hypothetical protein
MKVPGENSIFVDEPHKVEIFRGDTLFSFKTGKMKIKA